MSNRIVEDPRIDPRIKELFATLPPATGARIERREDLVALLTRLNSPTAPTLLSILAEQDYSVVPSEDLDIRVERIASAPDGNSIDLQIIQPRNAGPTPLPCVYYIHGGAMMVMSCFDENYRAWGRMMALCGVAVVMVDFRNALVPSSVPETAPFPAGLNDCVSGLRWLLDNARSIGVDAARVIVAGDSGGGNLAIATGLAMKRAGEAHRLRGLYALCPYIKGEWPGTEGTSELKNAAILLELRQDNGAVAYGIDALHARDPLAWPGFATEDDLRGLPPVKINVNECDPLLDEGVDLYRKLLRAGVSATCRQAMGTIHATETFVTCCPDISRDLARDIAAFARGD